MICTNKVNGVICEGRRSFCYSDGKEVCVKCGAVTHAETFIDKQFGDKEAFKLPFRLCGYSFKEAQGYKTWGILQKY